MTNAANTPASINLTQQAYALLKQINKAERPDGLAFGGVTFTDAPDRITATVVFPIERIDNPDGQTIRVVPMTK